MLPMPYIAKERRWDFEVDLENGVFRKHPQNPGELNYLLTELVLEYLAMKKKVNYQAINDVVGALESCKLEFYRRFVVPYEDKKIVENGDVYPPQQ